jgi:hypothetical protein
MINAVERAGKLRHGVPPVKAIVGWRGGEYGHVAKAARGDKVWGVDAPVVGLLGKVERTNISKRWPGYKYAGWWLAEDVPGWTK